MEITDIPVEGYERVARCSDEATGLVAFIAVHDTTLGPALGGLRLLNYAAEDEALTDVLRLSKGMTYKSAVAETGLGGGKSVIVGDPAKKTPELFRAMGRFVHDFGGNYITAEDMNIKIEDLLHVQEETPHVSGLSREHGGSGNPSPYTAYGCIVAMEAAAEYRWGTKDLSQKHVLLQGVGAVGGEMARLLRKRGARVTVCDIRQDAVDALVNDHGCESVSIDDHLDVECDIYGPGARGAGINDDTIPQISAEIICGCANNQLLDPSHGDVLREKGILYAPDYVVNAAGIINVSCERLEGGYDEEEAMRRIERIGPNLKAIFEIADRDGISTNVASQRLAEQRLADARQPS
ncbi:MAG: Glu/Leu/Phe/Val dehydrogenase dimerization domain-containing protein [Planctomycetota bacterium]